MYEFISGRAKSVACATEEAEQIQEEVDEVQIEVEGSHCGQFVC